MKIKVFGFTAVGGGFGQLLLTMQPSGHLPVDVIAGAIPAFIGFASGYGLCANQSDFDETNGDSDAI